MVCKQASTVGAGDLQSQEDLCVVRPCLCLVPNSVVATLKLAPIPELCMLTFIHESKKYVTQHAHVQWHAWFLHGCPHSTLCPFLGSSLKSLERSPGSSCFCSPSFMPCLPRAAKLLTSPANPQTMLCHCPLWPFLTSTHDRILVYKLCMVLL